MWVEELDDALDYGRTTWKLGDGVESVRLTNAAESCVEAYQEALNEIDVSTLLSEVNPMCLVPHYSIERDLLGSVCITLETDVLPSAVLTEQGQNQPRLRRLLQSARLCGRPVRIAAKPLIPCPWAARDKIRFPD